jgi:HD superfamily phosphohydrolase YqeK
MAGDALLARAATGQLPSWARAYDKRRAHIARVAQLLGEWAHTLAPQEEVRWRAAAWLHDSLRDADEAELRSLIVAEFADWPASLLHGPAAASQLRRDGVRDESVLRAIAYHTVGHADLDLLGRSLYLADFLEPGRKFAADWRADLRARMPNEHEFVLREVAAQRLGHLIAEKAPLRPETVGFWNSLV